MKRLHVEEGRPSGLSQVPYNGFYLRLEEGASAWLIVHGLQLLHQQGATLNPPVEGFHGGFGTTVRMVEKACSALP